MAKKINLQVGYTVDKTGLNEVIKTLESLQRLSAKDLLGLNKSIPSIQKANTELIKIKDMAAQVQNAFTASFNKGLGTINLSSLTKQLNSIGFDNIYSSFKNAGVQGESAFRKITSQALTTNMQLKQSIKLVDKMAETMGNTIRWGVASSAMNNFTSSIADAFNYVQKLDSSLNDIRIVTGKSAEEMAQFAQQANNIAKTLSSSTRDVTEGALIYYQQGDTEDTAVAKAEITQKAANVSQITAAEASEYLTAV